MRKSLVVAFLCSLGVSCSGTDQQSRTTTTAQTAATVALATVPVSTSIATPPELQDSLRLLLEAVGADVASAPIGATDLDGAVLCNTETTIDSLAGTAIADNQCFRDAIAGITPAVLVVADHTEEGDPIVRVQRTGSPSADIVVFEDSSQDAFGGGGWRSYECSADQIDRGNAKILTC